MVSQYVHHRTLAGRAVSPASDFYSLPLFPTVREIPDLLRKTPKAVSLMIYSLGCWDLCNDVPDAHLPSAETCPS
jgi:hypothetical protein